MYNLGVALVVQLVALASVASLYLDGYNDRPILAIRRQP